MSLQKVRWTVTPTRAPRPILNCHSCKTKRPFESSGKFRLNANGKRLDAWLVYNCVHCGSSWNRTVFERMEVSSISDELFEKLQSNDAAFAQEIAHDVSGLRQRADAVEGADTFAVKKSHVVGSDQALSLEITINVPHGFGPRLDRLLAEELGLSRSRVWELAKSGLIQVTSAAHEPLRRRLANGTVILLLMP
jgi:hypothetical protein